MARVSPRLIALDVEGTDRSNEVSKCVITSAPTDADFMSFTEARSGGGRDYGLDLTIAQDHAVGTLWDLIWTAPGTLADIIYAPYGNEVASAAQPHYAAPAKVAEPDGDFMGAEASDALTGVATIEVTWMFTAKPTKIIA